MTVQHVYVNDQIYDVPYTEENWKKTSPNGLIPTIKEIKGGAKPGPMSMAELMADPSFEMLYRFGVFCNTGNFNRKASTDPKTGKLLPCLDRMCDNGNASDYAFLKMAEAIPTVAALREGDDEGEFAIEKLRKLFPKANGRTADIPFNSKYKFMSTIVEYNGEDYLIVKGAAEQVFARSGSILIKGEEKTIDDAMQARFEDVYKTVAKMGERGLGFGFRKLGPRPEGNWQGGNPKDANFPIGTACKETNRADRSDALTYLGLMALIDPPREAVPSSVLSAQQAGVKVVMVTGDHPITAAAIAKTVNIIKDPTITDIFEDQGCSKEEAAAKARAIVCAGTDLDKMEQVEIQNVLLYEQVVFARTSPTQKLLIVEAAQKMGHIVAVTGDGVNDSPALSQADIGCAMGIAGTDVTKEAADMILLTDDFSAIVLGIEEGRLIFDNLKKSIAYTLSSNIPEISPFILFIIIRMPLSLTTVLILCVDLGTDMIPAISLAYETPESDIMFRPPRDAEKDRLVTDKLICFAYLQIGVFQALAGFFTFFCVLNDYGWSMSEIPYQALEFEPFPEDGKKISKQCVCGGGQKATGKNFFTDSFVPIKHGTLDTTNKGFSDLSADELAACPDADLGIKWAKNWPYGYGCPYGSVKPNKECKFGSDADNGAVGTWATPCYKPALALRVAQTSAFVSIVIVQWADLLICKTRLLSIADQGMQNPVMLFGLCSETLLCMALCYLPFMNTAFSTAPIHPVHWFPSMPFSVAIFLYDETRKYLLRQERKTGGGHMGFVEMYTYY
jgi:sodium/potassium-transporting ATPase subunit alpha